MESDKLPRVISAESVSAGSGDYKLEKEVVELEIKVRLSSLCSLLLIPAQGKRLKATLASGSTTQLIDTSDWK